ncbi:MAG: hypothetical protein Fur007_05300 [Rhodoferax sp.]
MHTNPAPWRKQITLRDAPRIGALNARKGARPRQKTAQVAATAALNTAWIAAPVARFARIFSRLLKIRSEW